MRLKRPANKKLVVWGWSDAQRDSFPYALRGASSLYIAILAMAPLWLANTILRMNHFVVDLIGMMH